jgi:hypothetical protein
MCQDEPAGAPYLRAGGGTTSTGQDAVAFSSAATPLSSVRRRRPWLRAPTTIRLAAPSAATRAKRARPVARLGAPLRVAVQSLPLAEPVEQPFRIRPRLRRRGRASPGDPIAGRHVCKHQAHAEGL